MGDASVAAVRHLHRGPAVTVVLLSLIVVSFARFHALRGAQYRNRQLADERSMGVNGAKNGFVSCNAINVAVDDSSLYTGGLTTQVCC